MGDLFDRIKQTLGRMKQIPIEPGHDPIPEESAEVTEETEEYMKDAGSTYMIRKAAQHRLLLYMLYNDQWRYVEPYSFRSGNQGLLIYGHCLTHNDTHSFYVNKIQDMELSEIPYNPRWYIEIG